MTAVVADQALGLLDRQDSAVADLARAHLAYAARTLNLVAASSPTLPAVSAAAGAGFWAVTAEGYPGARYHPAAVAIDDLESLARQRARSLFGVSHANVQPASGSAANLAVLYGLLDPGDRVLSLDLAHGGHLSHVSRQASISKRVDAAHYLVGDDGTVDPAALADLVARTRPRLVICGGSAYPRQLDFAAFRAAADRVDALLLADISHISGLVAAGVHPSPAAFCDLVTTSTYKQLRGPRGGLVMLGEPTRVSASTIDRAVFPGFQGTPDFAAIAGKAIAFRHAATPDFRAAMQRVVDYARIFAAAFTDRGVPMVTGGTDTHMVLLDLRATPVSGRVVADSLQDLGLLTNRNLVPADPRPTRETSGVRLGTNDLAFRDLTSTEITTLAGTVAAVVGDLVDERPGGPARALLSELVAEYSTRPHLD
ncbi:serine hydroxymethyltransferase [Actinokineospora enzanensis]|uniref:serine hydroxymethyltransferase n=1 Tax=Actinokineospora enzanensis TaxID=155975 RepID=UPI000377208E|nr:serine hydroxymethyltransferase [Actinokineospora enzanensis]